MRAHALTRLAQGLEWPVRVAGVLLTALVLLVVWALQENEHVRVDVLSRRWSARTRGIVECLGMLLVVLPFAVFVFLVSDDYVLRSHAIGERSGEPGGLPALWLQKALIPAMAVLLAVQALASAARALAGVLGDDTRQGQDGP